MYGLVEKGTENRLSNTAEWDLEYDPNKNKFNNIGSSSPSLWGIDGNGNGTSAFPTAANMQTHYLDDLNDNFMIQFDNPYYVAPEPEPVVEPVERIEATGGAWQGNYGYLYIETTPEGRFLYGLGNKSGSSANSCSGWDVSDIEYDPSKSKWYDLGSGQPYKWGIDANGNGISDFPTVANMQTHYWYHENGTLFFQFDNPYYVAPEPGYRYLAFYGETSVSLPTFTELELTLTDGTYIKYGNLVDVGPPVETKEWGYYLERNNLSDIFDGDYVWNDRLMYDLGDETNKNRVLFYFDCTTNRDVQSGAFWHLDQAAHSWDIGKLYGTNTDPLTFTDATLPSEWTYIIDLTRNETS